MTDDKKKSELEKLRLYPKIGSVVAILLIYGGLAIMAIFALLAVPTMQLADPNHLTDPAIPYNQMENATYTWTADELVDKALGIAPAILLGAGLSIGGLAVAFVIPSNKRLHRVHCTGDGEKKYCPECGLKLSELEGKG